MTDGCRIRLLRELHDADRLRHPAGLRPAEAMMLTIAGHIFTDLTLEGRKCDSCGRRWIDIAGVSKQDIGQPGWAHFRDLTATDFAEIEAERERVYRLAMGPFITSR